jgi:cAMP-dependent protein kinase regulator
MGCGASKKKEEPAKGGAAKDPAAKNKTESKRAAGGESNAAKGGGGAGGATAAGSGGGGGAAAATGGADAGATSGDGETDGSTYVRKRRAGVSAEAVTQEQMDDDSPLPVHPKTDEQTQRITDAISGHLLFRHLSAKQMSDIVAAMFEVRVKKRKVIIKQGDAGHEVDNFYIVETGECEVLIARGGSVPKHFSNIKPGGYFGELALMYSTPRAATVRATQDSTLWAVDRTTFRRILLISILQRRRLYEEFLASVPLLDAMTSYETSNLCDALVERRILDGEILYEEGDAGDAFYIVEEGAVIVERAGKFVSELGAGEAFGEVVLLTDQPCDATVRAKGDTKLVFVNRQSFNGLLGPCIDMLKRNMGLYRSLKESDAYKEHLGGGGGGAAGGGGGSGGLGAEESAGPSRSRSRRTAVSSEALVADDNFVPTVVPKTTDQEMRIRQAISKNFLFASLTEDILAKVIGAMFEVKKVTGDIVMREGDEGDNFYILEDGECEFLIKDNVVGKVASGGSFGELALMYDSPRAATVRVATPTALLWGVDRQSFRQLVLTSTLKKRRMYESFLQEVPILQTLTNYERSTLADAFQEKVVSKGDKVISQGEDGDASFYIVAEGAARVTADVGGSERDLKSLTKGDYFGEIALLERKPRAANVVVESDKATMLYIEGDAFHRLLGNISDILRRNMDEYDQRMKEVQGDVIASGPVDL